MAQRGPIGPWYRLASNLGASAAVGGPRRAAGRPVRRAAPRLLKRRSGPTDSHSDVHPPRNAHRFSGWVARRKPGARNTRPRPFHGNESSRGYRSLLLRKAVFLGPSGWILTTVACSTPPRGFAQIAEPRACEAAAQQEALQLTTKGADSSLAFSRRAHVPPRYRSAQCGAAGRPAR